MRPIQDIDAIVLLAVALAAKRRPATLADIVAAADLIQGVVPFVDKLGEALQRLSGIGLIEQADGGLTLTPAAQELMAGQPRKADTEDRIIAIKTRLASYAPKGEFPAITLQQEEITAAIRAHKAARKAPGTNLLMPKPKADRHFKVDGRWRRAPAKRGGKA